MPKKSFFWKPFNRREGIFTQLSQIKEILLLSWKAQPACFTGVIFLEFIQSFIPIGLAWITKLIFDLLAESLFGNSGKEQWPRLVLFLAIQLTLTILNQMISLLIGYLSAELGRKLNLEIQVTVYRKINDLQGLASFETPRIQNTIKLASQGAQMGSNQALSILNGLLHNTISLVGFLGVLLAINPLFAGLVLLAVLPRLSIQFKSGQQHFDLSTQNSPLERLSGYFSALLSTVYFAKEVRLLNLADSFLEAFKKIIGEINQNQKNQQIRESRWQAGFSVFSSLVTEVIFMLVILQAFLGENSLGDVTFYISAVSNVQSALSDLIFNFANIHECLLFFSNYTDLLALPQPVYIPAKPMHVFPLKKGIEFQNVSFRYTEEHPWVLRNFNLYLPAGQCLALVGLNGSGKTTLIKLLLRFYDPGEGQILWDGMNIRDVDPAELRRHIGSLFQDFVHFEFTAYENIALGDVDLKNETLRDARVKQSAVKAGIHNTLEALPKGYQTTLSRWLAEDERGVDLSGGEWQKVALARLLIRDSDLLILDEPTSSLDAQAEYEIYGYLKSLLAGKTSLLISHRFSTVRRADKIAVMEKGAIQEYGTHDELMAFHGLYQRLYRLQADQYR